MIKRRFVICADGTWNTTNQNREKGEKPTNVVHVARATLPIDSNDISQFVYYQDGVGTSGWKADEIAGGAFGEGVGRNVRRLYRFLINNHQSGDEIFLFGFSRGAYTVRSLTGVITKCGLLDTKDANREEEAWNLYLDRKADIRGNQAVDFRKNYSREIKVAFLGVWDTVGSFGIPGAAFGKAAYEMPDKKLSQCVTAAYQALSIDENRNDFLPCLWESASSAQKMQQVWFVGGHSHVGGGYKNPNLSNIALNWMIRKAEKHGLEFNQGYLRGLTEDHSAPFELESQRRSFWRHRGTDTREIPTGSILHHSVYHRFYDPALKYKPEKVKGLIANCEIDDFPPNSIDLKNGIKGSSGVDWHDT